MYLQGTPMNDSQSQSQSQVYSNFIQIGLLCLANKTLCGSGANATAATSSILSQSIAVGSSSNQQNSQSTVVGLSIKPKRNKKTHCVGSNGDVENEKKGMETMNI